jgi:SAM-dependent methyltransferase
MLNKKPNDLLEDFLIDYCKIFNMSYDESKSMIKDSIKYYNGLSNTSITIEMENKWYNELSTGIADYSIYDNDYYFVDLWCCWKMYSRNYIKILNSNGTLIKYFTNKSIVELLSNNSKTIIDLGCGLGYSTAGLKELFPKCDVFGFNIKDTKQYKFCEFMSKKYQFNMISYYNNIGNIDIIFASEYFEHFERPIEHLEDLILSLKPKHIIIANSFNTKSIGHFINYKHHNEIINQKDISRKFNKSVLSFGYEKIKTKIFNNKPNIYSIKNES